nr:T9SS type A sorting domain-containing protein [Bacteroidota bacterium]
SSCTQRIWVVNFFPIVEDSIIWPLDYHGVECSLGTDPDDLDPPYDRPIINEDECDLIGINYEDLVFNIVDGACYKILRTWRVIDWCLYEQFGGLLLGYNYWEHVQIIKVVNQFGPVFLTDQPDIELCNDFDCGGLFVELIQRAADDCTPDELLQWQYAVDLNNDGSINIGPITGLGALIDASGIYPIGTHRIIYSFEDRCGNRTVEEQFITIGSCKAPVPVCIYGLSTDLMAVDTDGDGIEDTGMITIWASDFDASSYHPCGLPFTLSLSPDPTVKSRTFDCSHVGQGQVPVRLYVTDEDGDQAYCETFIIIQDNNNVCPDDGNLTGTITGNVSTETTDNVLDVEVQVAGSTYLPTTTNQTGTYTFPAMPIGGHYVVNPAKDDDYKNGVSTLDLVNIQKHLLGIKNLESPYKLIAADANDSKSITAVDLIELRKLILGITTDLPNNTSWRFVDKSYVFPDPYNPWMQVWPESREMNPLATGMNQANFYGIKIGDVNNTVKANANSIVTRGSGDIMALVIDEQQISVGQTVEVPVYAGAAQSLEGMQFSFELGAGLSLADVVAGTLDVTNENFGWLQNRILTGSWNNATAVAVDGSQPLFTLILSSATASNLSKVISITSAPTKPEAYTVDSEIMDISLTFRGADTDAAFELLQNEPNPFTGRTEIGFVLPESGAASFTVFDLAGRQLLNQTIQGQKGLNKVEISKEQLSAQGMLYYQVQFQGYTATKKMLIL